MSAFDADTKRFCELIAKELHAPLPAGEQLELNELSETLNERDHATDCYSRTFP